MAIYAKCATCDGHIVSFFDEPREVMENGKPVWRVMDVWVHDVEESEDEFDHPATPRIHPYEHYEL